MTVVEQLFEEIRNLTPINDALRMQLEADVQVWLQKEQEQLNKARQGGASISEAQIKKIKTIPNDPTHSSSHTTQS